MFLRIVKARSGSVEREYVRLVESVRGPDGKVKQRLVCSLGRKDLLVQHLPALLRLLQGEPATRHVELGGDVNSAGEHGWTALHGAAYKGVDAAVQFLIERGARTDVFDEYGQTPLSIASTIITVRSNDAYYQSSRIFRKTTVDLLLKLGAVPLAESGVEILGQFYKQP